MGGLPSKLGEPLRKLQCREGPGSSWMSLGASWEGPKIRWEAPGGGGWTETTKKTKTEKISLWGDAQKVRHRLDIEEVEEVKEEEEEEEEENKEEKTAQGQ